LSAVEKVNEAQKGVFIGKILDYFSDKIKTIKIAFWGLAFKANTDDIRESPSLAVLSSLQKEGAFIQIYDPEAEANTKKYFAPSKQMIYCDSAKASLENVDALVICTDWDEFKNFDYSPLKNSSCKVIFDGRNILHEKEILALGLDYFSVGKKPCYHQNGEK
jgi:UDPglucose 6-dehydrogenase